MPTPSVINNYRWSDAISRTVWDTNYALDTFNMNPLSCMLAGGATSGTDGDTNVLITNQGLYEFTTIGTQTVLAPVIDDVGLNWAQTATEDQGQEITVGRTASSPFSFKIGTSAAFYLRTQWTVKVVDGVLPLIVGFMITDTFEADFTDYTDYAMVGINDADGALFTETNKGGAGEISVDTTQAAVDEVPFSLEVLVSKTGVATFLINGQAPLVTQAYTFRNGVTVVPVMRTVQSATTTDQVSNSWFECGFQS